MVNEALGNAVFYAESLEKYPPEALRADRESARRFYTFSSLEEALKNETDRAKVAIEVSLYFRKAIFFIT